MNKRYFSTTFRHLWRHRLFTSLNIFGLAISISACWIIFRIVSYEFSYEKNLPEKDRVYRVESGFIFDGKEEYNAGASAPMYQGIRESIGAVELAVPLHGQWAKAVQIARADGKPLVLDDPTNIAATDADYFSMIPYHWLAGNPSTAFQGPDKVVLTQSRAAKYFPGIQPQELLHRTIIYYGFRDTVTRTITGIVADPETPTEFTTQEFCSLPQKAYELNTWTNTNGQDKLYVRLKKDAKPEKVLGQINSLVQQKVKLFNASHGSEHFDFKRWFILTPIKDSHFTVDIKEYNERKASKKVLYGLVGISLFLLILACINYINMSVAAMPQRAREIGVRKTLGSGQARLIGQFLFQTLLTTLIAAVLAHALSLIGFVLLKDIIPPGVSPFGSGFQLLGFVAVVSVIVTFLAGIYPGWLITRVKTVDVFRTGHIFKNTRGFSLQRALIVFQFVIALAFISCAIVVGRQLQYVLKTDMGFTKDAVVLADIPWKYRTDQRYADKHTALLHELKKIPGIKAIAEGSPPMTESFSSSQYEYLQEGKEPIRRQVFRKWVDTAYLNLYGLQLLAGRNLHPSDTANEYVINEAALHAFDFKSPQDAIGKFIGPQEQKFPIVGVIKDFHAQNFYSSIDPLDLECNKENLGNFNIKLAGNDPAEWQATLKKIEKKWYAFYPPESLKFRFYDEIIEDMYTDELHMARLINLATGMAIFISCLGLFGLAVLTAYQRTKEIGIRKVLGASVATIVQLLSKEYLRLVVISMLIAVPIAWWAMKSWLQNFVYRVQLSWWMFALAGLMGIVLALITVGFHALKAARANPVDSLRTE